MKIITLEDALEATGGVHHLARLCKLTDKQIYELGRRSGYNKVLLVEDDGFYSVYVKSSAAGSQQTLNIEGYESVANLAKQLREQQEAIRVL